ncbi:uncharacterized protein BDZ99DRAFT_526676 [Mytilinidion resinicola]|uniref:Uncharacterized protein n=1 Tax=Mytilinidion resinicola TaxID=574789 RepID=A0A6A6Y459_9PEZI|nr:uncharacterized protein BDZ99DRAFT_526676 [Mytilinidion resinicola]KAF2803308.1 hypothetical protein BDZ99DRAFT_526676 [Mytilinidion resinicola]
MADDHGQRSLWRKYNALVARNEAAERALRDSNRAAEASVRAQLTEAFGQISEPAAPTARASTRAVTPRHANSVQTPPAGLELPTPRHVTSTAGPPPATPPVTPYHVSRSGHGFSNAASERASTVAPEEIEILDMDIDSDRHIEEAVDLERAGQANPTANTNDTTDPVKTEESAPVIVQGGEVVDLCGSNTSDEEEEGVELEVVEEPRTPVKPPPSLARHFSRFRGDPVSPMSPTPVASTSEQASGTQAQNEKSAVAPTQSQSSTALTTQKAGESTASSLKTKPAASASAAGSSNATNPSTPKPARKRAAPEIVNISDEDSDYAPQDSPPPPPKRPRPAAAAKKNVTIASPLVTPSSNSKKSGSATPTSALSKKRGPGVMKPIFSHTRKASHPTLHDPLSTGANMRMRTALMAPPPLGGRVQRVAATKARQMTGLVVREEARMRKMSDDALMDEIEDGRVVGRLSLEPPAGRRRGQ